MYACGVGGVEYVIESSRDTLRIEQSHDVILTRECVYACGVGGSGVCDRVIPGHS